MRARFYTQPRSKGEKLSPSTCFPLRLRQRRCGGCTAMTVSCQNQTSGSYSITSSARARSVGGIVRPIALAVLRLIVAAGRPCRRQPTAVRLAPHRSVKPTAMLCRDCKGSITLFIRKLNTEPKDALRRRYDRSHWWVRFCSRLSSSCTRWRLRRCFRFRQCQLRAAWNNA